MIKKLIMSFIGFILFALWLELSKSWCESIIIPIIFFIFITKNTYMYAKAKKVCLAKCYFNEKSFIYLLWTRKTFIFLRSIFVGFVLTFSLFVVSTEFKLIDMIILFFDSFFLIFLYFIFEKTQTFNQKVKIPIVKNVTASINSIILVLVFFTIALYQTPPPYIQIDLLSTLKIIEKENYSQCEIIDTLAYINKIIFATKWWLVSKVTVILENQFFKTVLWFFQLVGNYLVVFAYSRFILEFVEIFNFQKEETKNEK